MDDVTFLNRIAESWPVVITLLVAIIIGGGRLSFAVVNALLARIDRKDEQIVNLQKETLVALHHNTEAIKELRQAIKN